MKDAIVNLPELRAQIARADISRATLAREAGVSRPTVHRILSGAPIALATLGRVCSALNRALEDCGQPPVEIGQLIQLVDVEENTAADVEFA